MHRLDDVLTTRCGLVVGPRGSGKTTVMRQWARTARLPVVWGRCTPAGIAVRAGTRTEVLAPDEVGTAVLARRAPTLLVLDDAHELLVGRVEDDLERLLLSSSPDVHVLLGTVRRPAFSLARSEFPPPVVLDADDLRLRVWEVDRLFRDVYGHPLALDDVELLTDETEGWAAAVHLFHRSTQGLLPADRRRAVRSLDTDTGYVRDYLVDEVLAPLDRAHLDALHWGSVFDDLTARRLADLVGSAGPAAGGAAETLRVLDRRWSLARTDDGVRYRLPRVLRRHLRTAHAEHLGPTATQAWRERAALVVQRDAPAALAGTGDEHAVRPPVRGHDTDGTPTAARTWASVVEAATRRDPLAGARDAAALTGADGALADGLCRVLAGAQRAGRDALRRAAADPDASPAVALGAALADAVLTPGAPGWTLTTLDRVHTAARAHDLPWLARLAHGLVVGTDGTRTARTEAAAIAARADRSGDPWGAVLVLTWAALAALTAGSAEPDVWDDLDRRWRDLDAAVPAAWMTACRALASAAQQLPEAREDARTAEAVARAAGSPGAIAYAYAALAATDPDGGAELRALATATADEHGVDVRPWAVLAAATPGSPVRRPRSVDDPVWGGVPLLDVRCLGEFRLRVDGVDADLSGVRPRARAALRVLALHAGRPVHREQLAEALWGDLDPRAALHNLHVSLSAVRRALEPGVSTRSSRLVVRDGETYTLVLRPGSTSDVAELERAVREARRLRVSGDDTAARRELARAVDLYTGDLLPEDGPADWVVAERERLRLTAADAAVELAELEVAHGRLDRAVAAATRAIRLDECRDHAWRLLVTAFTAAGDTAAAHRATQGYRAMLDTLGVAVGDEAAVRATIAPPEPSRRRVAPVPMVRAVPHVAPVARVTRVAPVVAGSPVVTGAPVVAGSSVVAGTPTAASAPLVTGASVTAGAAGTGTTVTSGRGTPPPRSPRASRASRGTWS